MVNRASAIVNGGMVMLFAGQEKMPSARAAVGENGFQFAFVPEGRYRLEAFGMDVTFTEVPAAQAAATGVALEQKISKMYGWQHQPLIVQSDISGLVVTVPEPAAKPAPAQ